MHLLSRPRLFAVAALLSLLAAVLAIASQQAGSAKASAPQAADARLAGRLPAGEHGAVPHRGHEGRRQLLDPGVRGLRLAGAEGQLRWIPAGQTAASACGDENGTLGDDAAAYCPSEDTLYISQKFATDIYNGTLDRALPGSSQGYGKTVGDFSVAYIVAHEYAHQVQGELGVLQDGRGPRR